MFSEEGVVCTSSSVNKLSWSEQGRVYACMYVC